MSSLRNSVQRRSHRERAQPLERARLGLLEKKKDYQKRAKDYNKKKAVLKSLHEKAAERNEDEFYFGMLSRSGPGSRLSRGKAFTGTVDGDRGNKAMDMDTVRLLKTQDLGYLRTMRNVAAKEVKELEERFILAGGAEVSDEESEEEEDFEADEMVARPPRRQQIQTKAKRIVFCDGVEERDQAAAAAAAEGEQRNTRSKSVGGEDEDMWNDFDDKPTSKSEEEGDEEAEKKQKEAERKARNLERLQTRLRNAKKKLKALTDAEYELALQQAKMAKTATSGGITKTGRRIKVKERKR
ncbi:small-subunit processome [Apodospora peruviana]|uniref:Small-subunit processome n=1 Tax=Apodospora peruviana TaxID=516989 RepID=A0AAE0IRR8_9PEZI|nr:small-subunit processome [Apodospora peruviana]